MKKLIFIRHGKSSWKHELPDEKRPLKKRAYKDANVVITAFKGVVEKPLTLWSSYAERALHMARIFKEELEIDDRDFEIREELYTFEQQELLETIASCDESVEQLMIFGHNPAMTEVVNSLGDIFFENIPTTGLTMIEFSTDSWKDLRNGKTLLYLFPKNLR